MLLRAASDGRRVVAGVCLGGRHMVVRIVRGPIRRDGWRLHAGSIAGGKPRPQTGSVQEMPRHGRGCHPMPRSATKCASSTTLLPEGTGGIHDSKSSSTLRATVNSARRSGALGRVSTPRLRFGKLWDCGSRRCTPYICRFSLAWLGAQCLSTGHMMTRSRFGLHRVDSAAKRGLVAPGMGGFSALRQGDGPMGRGRVGIGRRTGLGRRSRSDLVAIGEAPCMYGPQRWACLAAGWRDT